MKIKKKTYMYNKFHKAELILEKLIHQSASQELPSLLWNPKVHYCVRCEVLRVAKMSMLLFWVV
jgi:hypothetical protein